VTPTDEADLDYWEIAAQRKPRKWLSDDDENPVLNPAYVTWRDATARVNIEARCTSLGVGSVDHEIGQYYPEDYGKAIPPEGAWIRIVQVPHTELASRFEVPLLSMWRARPGRMNSGKIRITKGDSRSPRLAVIDTPGGELWLWAHEYVMVENIMDWVGQEPDVEMHQMSGQPAFTEDDEERLFYIQSRGISRVEAAKMLLPGLEDTKFCYFTMHPEYVRLFDR
jgi:hypothetical protein